MCEKTKVKIKRFIECYVPVYACNLRCHYCYITHQGLFKKEVVPLTYSPEFLGKALSVERLGGICLFNLCAAGETLLCPDLHKYVYELLKQGHYVMIVTNGTLSKAFDEFIKLPEDCLKRLFFKFSYHFLEFKKKNLMDTFFNNIEKVKKAGCSFTVEITPSDELVPYIEEVKSICLDKTGALPHVTVARDEHTFEKHLLTKYPREEYNDIWSSFKSDLFDFKFSVFEEKRNEFCYAGDWSICVNLLNGDTQKCYADKVKQNIFKDINKPIIFQPIGKCKDTHCHNAHAFMGFGLVPDYAKDIPTYTKMRNKTCNDGSNWVTEEMKSCFDCRLKDSNKELPTIMKILTRLKRNK